MGEFQASFNAIRSRDLKRIYSVSPQVPKYRTSKLFPNKDSINLKCEDKNLDARVLKSSEFIREYNCHIPRAPAFRVFSHEEVNKMVRRVKKPTFSSIGYYIKTNADVILQDKKKNRPRFLGLQKINQQEQNDLNKKIMRDTHSSYLRQCLTTNAKKGREKLQRDLKYINSRFPQVLKYRHTKPYPTQEQLKTKEKNNLQKTYVLRSSEFVPKYRCLIPRATAFQILSRHEVDSVVSRLTRPKIASQGISLSNVDAMSQDKVKNHLKYLGLQKINHQEQNDLNKKIGRHTHSTQLRKYLTTVCKERG